MTEPEPLDENLLREVRFFIWLVLQLEPSPLDEDRTAWLSDVMIGCPIVEGRRSEFWWARYASEGVTHRLAVEFVHDEETGDVRDLTITSLIEPETKFWWLMWFAAYLKGPRDILP